MLICVSLNSFETDNVKCLVKSLCVKVYLLGFNNEVGESFKTESSQKDTETRLGSNFNGSNNAFGVSDRMFPPFLLLCAVFVTIPLCSN